MNKFWAGIFFSLIPALAFGALASTLNAKTAVVVFVGVFAFGLMMCFDKSREDTCDENQTRKAGDQ